MSKENVSQFITLMEDADVQAAAGFEDPEPAEVVSFAAGRGLNFSEDDLKSALNTRICNAESLPRPWGWALARKFGLVRS